MNDVGIEIAILSLGQILVVAQEQISDPKSLETVERHVRQVAAVLQGRHNNKPDESTVALLGKVRTLLTEATA